MKHKVALSIFSFCLFAISSTTVNAGFIVRGYGSDSCGDFVSAYAKNTNQRTAYMVYVLGYISGANWKAVGEVSSGIDNSSIELALVKHCRENPFDSFVKAIMSVYDQMEKMQN